MEHQKLIDYFSSFVKLNDADRGALTQAYTVKHHKKKELLFERDAVCSTESFVTRGSVRVFYNDSKGNEHILYFAFPDWWVSDMSSFNDRSAASLSAETLEPCTVLQTNPENKEVLLKSVPSLERVFRLITQKHVSALQKRFLMAVSESAEERYKELVLQALGIELLVTQRQIASYLGIVPESLSRMKRQLMGK
jgi:CRP-like cAMP-binding protein